MPRNLNAPLFSWVIRQARGLLHVQASNYTAARALADASLGAVVEVMRADCWGASDLEGLGSGTLAAIANGRT